MTLMSTYTALTYETAIANAVADKNLEAAVTLLRLMAVDHPYRAEQLLDSIEGQLDVLRPRSVEEGET